jgi:hypothetical protein
MNPWAWTDRNPYYETAFQVLDLDPAVDRASARARITARRKRISYNADRFPLFGESLSVARVNAAEEQLATVDGRIAAELLTHTPEAEGEDLPVLAELMELRTDLRERYSTATGTSVASWLHPSALLVLLPAPDDPQHPTVETDA